MGYLYLFYRSTCCVHCIAMMQRPDMTMSLSQLLSQAGLADLLYTSSSPAPPASCHYGDQHAPAAAAVTVGTRDHCTSRRIQPVIDRRLRPRCCHPGSYFKRPKCSSLRPLVILRTVCSQAQGCVCAALQLGGDVEQPWLTSKHDVIHKTGST